MASMDESRSISNKHIMLSYQRKNTKVVLQFYDYLTENQSIPVWMDRHGGVQQYLSTSLAEGVENCCLMVCFLTAEYQQSEYCKKELRYACELKKPILPCILPSNDTEKPWKPSQWLGFTISDMIYLNLKHLDQLNFEIKAKELIGSIHSILHHQQTQPSIQIKEEEKEKEEEEGEDEGEEFETDLSFELPEDVSEGPKIRNDQISRNEKEFNGEGDSSIMIINGIKQIECNQDMYSKNGSFKNSFVLSDLVFYNRSSELNGILRMKCEYENKDKQWIECSHQLVSNEQSIITLQPYQSFKCSIQINIQLNGTPGSTNQSRSRAHSLLPQPLLLKIHVQDLFNKNSSIIIQQVNKPLNLPELNQLIEKMNLNEKNVIDFVYTDDCSIDSRYFVLIYVDKQNDENVLKFRFGCDSSLSYNPFWNKQLLANIEKQAKKENQLEILVHKDILNSIIQSKLLLNDKYKIQAIQFEIRTQTSFTKKTIRLSLRELLSDEMSFF